jgi:hypothetical protein
MDSFESVKMLVENFHKSITKTTEELVEKHARSLLYHQDSIRFGLFPSAEINYYQIIRSRFRKAIAAAITSTPLRPSPTAPCAGTYNQLQDEVISIGSADKIADDSGELRLGVVPDMMETCSTSTLSSATDFQSITSISTTRL